MIDPLDDRREPDPEYGLHLRGRRGEEVARPAFADVVVDPRHTGRCRGADRVAEALLEPGHLQRDIADVQPQGLPERRQILAGIRPSTLAR
ncbi:hypothetical protein ACFRI7_02965 [Streptomyces sp. NPDC056716]|uniref:hypothetical protein n=1 Tax=unclassified Streptomyces TaxID=2593676 RepID=UPI0036C14EA7